MRAHGRDDRGRHRAAARRRSTNRSSRGGSKAKTRAPKRRRPLRISAGDCAALGRGSPNERLGDEAHARTPTPSPPLSRCRLSGHGVSINVYLDSGFAAHQRYCEPDRGDGPVQHRKPRRPPPARPPRRRKGRLQRRRQLDPRARLAARRARQPLADRDDLRRRPLRRRTARRSRRPRPRRIQADGGWVKFGSCHARSNSTSTAGSTSSPSGMSKFAGARQRRGRWSR